MLASTASVRADVDDQARIRYERAVKLYEEGVYDAALVELRRAYDLRPSYKLFYNMALSRVAMRDYAGALEDYLRYLREGGERVAADRKSAVQGEIERLEQRVARLNIKTDVAGAEVLVDDVAVGTTPLPSAVAVNSGVRRVAVRHRDHPTQTLRVSIAGGEVQELNLPLTAGSAPTAQPLPSSPRDEAAHAAPLPSPALPKAIEAPPAGEGERAWSSGHRRALRAAAWGTTAALATVAVALGVSALVNEASIADARPKPVDDPDAFASKATRTERMALASDVFAGAAVAAAGVSLWLTLRTRVPREQRTDLRPRAGWRAATAEVAVRPAGVMLRTRF
jgi:hypothetical protein